MLVFFFSEAFALWTRMLGRNPDVWQERKEYVTMSNRLRDRMRWALIGWMFAISAIAYLDRVHISIAGHSIQQEFHLDNIQLGWVFSAFVAATTSCSATSMAS